MAAMPIYGKNLLQNRGCLQAESLRKSGTGVVPKLLLFDSFTAGSSLLPCVFVWAPYIRMEKLLIISNDFSSEASGPVLLKFHVESPWGRRMKDC